MARPAPETGGGLLLCLDASEGLFQFVETVASTCQQFVYELETIGTPGRQRLSRLVVPLRSTLGMGHLIVRETISKITKLDLTRRANQLYKAIIARNIEKPARNHRRRAFCLPFTNRTAAARHDASSPAPCLRVGSEPPSEP
jgi:hypothetical protein